MKKPFLVLCFLALCTTVTSQEYRKYWKDGQLTWNDFQGNPNQKQSTYLAYSLIYNTDKKLINNVMYHGLFSDAYIDKSLSYFHPNLKNDGYLKYNQVILNLIELGKRQLQLRLFELNSVFDSNSLLMDTKRHLEQKIADFQEESNYGLQESTTKKWLDLTYKKLSATNNYLIPDYKKSFWTYGMYAGLDFGMYGNTFKEQFNNTLALTLGFEFSYKKVFLLLNMSLTNSKLNEDIQHQNFSIAKGEKSSISHLNFAVGYPIYDSNRIKIMPFVGYGITGLGEIGDHKNKKEITKGSSSFGINIDFKNRKRVNFTPSFFNIKEEGNTFIRTRVFLNNTTFNPNLKGYSINIGIAYGFEARLLSKKK